MDFEGYLHMSIIWKLYTINFAKGISPVVYDSQLEELMEEVMNDLGFEV